MSNKMSLWTLKDVVKFLTKGTPETFYCGSDCQNLDQNGWHLNSDTISMERHGMRAHEFDALPASFRDGMLTAAMAAMGSEHHDNWLIHMDKITPSNRLETLKSLVEERRTYDRRSPWWLLEICKEACSVKFSLLNPVPPEWINELRKLVEITPSTDNHPKRAETVIWLALYDKKQESEKFRESALRQTWQSFKEEK